MTVKYPTITREYLEKVPRGVAQVPRERETREGVNLVVNETRIRKMFE